MSRANLSFADARGGQGSGSGMYNRSSLALASDSGEMAPAWQPMPRLMPRQTSPEVKSPRAPLANGADVLSFPKDSKSRFVAIAIHALVIGGVLWVGMMAHRTAIEDTVVTPVHLTLYDPPPPVMPVAKVKGGGGGGGMHRVIAPVKAPPPPKVRMVHMLPPRIAMVERPKLAVAPSSQINMRMTSAMPAIGLPNSPQIALASHGSGAQSGIGSGMGGGIGMGQGSGMGAGGGAGYGGGVMNVGGGVSAPVVIHSVEPEFTAAARQANFGGTVSIQLIVDPQGNPQDVRVVRHLGMGLDQKAIDAVRQYRFRPAMYQGHPVAVQMIIQVNFQLH